MADGRSHARYVVAAGLLGMGLGFCGLRRLAFPWAERALLTTKPNGDETPADAGLDFDAFLIPSGGRELHAWFVKAQPQGDIERAVLILHGRHEAISQWVPVQEFLCRHHISSMVFDYSGFGDSTGSPSVANLREDVQSAYEAFQSRTNAPAWRRYVLAYSLGTGLALEALPAFGDSIDGLILIAAYSSARDAIVELGMPFPLALILPDLYDNVRRVRDVHVPLLIVHSRGDTVFPVRMAERIYRAARQPKELVVLDGLSHSDLVRGRTAEYLAPVPGFIELAEQLSSAPKSDTHA